jgi:hypothetical protein
VSKPRSPVSNSMVDRRANPISRRKVLQGSLAGWVFAPLLAAAAEPDKNDEPACAAGANKCSWTLVRPQGTVQKDFHQFVLHELAGASGNLVGEPTSITVTLQKEGAFSSANVRLGGGDRPVDALVEIESSSSYPAISKINEYLLAHCDHVQGWRVRSTLIYDASTPVAIGARSSLPSIVAFIKRLDGTTPEHFDRNWLRHAETAKREGGGAHGQYAQNRVVEPITPTAWVANGYSQLTIQKFIPGVGARAPGRGDEESFHEWPPRILQGYAYRIL